MNENIVEFPDSKAVREEAAHWLIRLDGDEPPSPEAIAALREWMTRSPMHRQELQRLAATWRRMNVLTELAVPLGRYDAQKVSFARKILEYWNSKFVSRLAFVALSCVVVYVALLASRPMWQGYLDGSKATHVTRIGEQRLIILNDGSTVRLNTDSEISVNFTQEFRDIRLARGEAEFIVAKNPARPFRVYAGNERVQALGTAFTVYLQKDQIDVVVTEGEVALARRSAEVALPEEVRREEPAAKEEVPDYVEVVSTLRAGQSARMNLAIEGSSLLSALDVEVMEQPEDIDRRLAWREGLLIFDGDSLETVVREISRYTTLAIEITDPVVGATKIGGQFPVGETEAMLDILENSFGFTVTRLGKSRVQISAAAN